MAPPTCVETWAITDTGSQRTYVTSCVKESLQLLTKQTESTHQDVWISWRARFNLWGSWPWPYHKGLWSFEGDHTSCLVYCTSLAYQPTNYSRNPYDHLLGIKLVDSADIEDVLEVDMLIGSDFYWSLVTGIVWWGRSGPMAVHTKLEWILSGPVDWQEASVYPTLTATHMLRIDTHPGWTEFGRPAETLLGVGVTPYYEGWAICLWQCCSAVFIRWSVVPS